MEINKLYDLVLLGDKKAIENIDNVNIAKELLMRLVEDRQILAQTEHTLQWKIRKAREKNGILQEDLAQKFNNTTSATFYGRVRNDKFTTEELQKIAEIIGASYISAFVFPDGTKIF